MKKQLSNLFIITTVIVGLSSCRTHTPGYDYRKLAKASIKLGIDIDMYDNHKLYMEAAEWVGVPYRWSGNNKRGIDCSGLTCQIYKNVYKKKLDRSTDGQRTKNCKKVAKRNLQEGDLVFFASERSKRKVAHVGIYLKNNKFIHASTSKGVILSDLSEPYYSKHWLVGGRVIK